MAGARTVLKWLGLGVLATLMVIQLVPYGRNHENPPVSGEPLWDSSTTRELAIRACFDCHSNETRWPWYSNIAPMSWVIQRDVYQGREKLNWSEWESDGEGEESAETVLEGSMPPDTYTLLHPEARLSETEIAGLIAGLEATFGSEEASAEGDDE